MSDSLASDTTASTTLELVPEIIYEAPLVYSNLRGSQGTVILSVKVDSDGFVENAIVSRSSGFEDLDLAAVSCLYGWRFKPAFSAEKRPVPVWVMIPITYIYP
jgi:protein TonB